MILADLKPYIAWLQLHPHYAAAATFMVALIECIAVLGLIIPGTVMMTAIGALIGADIIPVTSTIIAAIVGAITGDVFSFWVGAHFHNRLRDMWPFRFYPNLLAKGEKFFYRHGGTGVFLGRFIGPLRPILPIVAGMLNMPTIRFLFADIISGILWAPVYLLPGILIGAASQQLPPEIATEFVVYVILVLLILWAISWLLKILIVNTIYVIHLQLNKVWAAIKHKPWLKPLSIALQDPLQPESHNQLTLALYWLLTVIIFTVLAICIARQGVAIAWNIPVWNFMRSIRTDFIDQIMIYITFIGEKNVIGFMYCAVLAWFFIQKKWRVAAHWFALGLLTFGGADVLKHLVHSLRPVGLVVSPSGYSFPSGHATLSAAIFGTLAVFIARELASNLRWIPYTCAIILCLLIDFSRLYLGAHWLTDIIGGLLFGLTIVMLIVLSYRRHTNPSFSPISLSLVAIISLVIAWSGFSYKHYKEAFHDYSLYTPARITNTAAWWSQQLPIDVLLRTNRAGKVVEILNVQWAGELTDIEQVLSQRGWVVTPKTTLGIILNQMAQPERSLTFPILPQLYLDKKPVLVMTKIMPTGNAELVLRLWDAKTTFSDSQLPLWLGTISYDRQFEKEYLRKHKHQLPPSQPLTPAILALSKDLTDFAWKMAAYPQVPIMAALEDTGWNGFVILVRPALMVAPKYDVIPYM